MDFEEVGAQLKAARVTRGLSILKAAELSGVSRRHIGQIEKGMNLTIGKMVALMRVYGMSEISIAGLVVKGRTAGLSPATARILAEELKRTIQHLLVILETLQGSESSGAQPELGRATTLVKGAPAATRKTRKKPVKVNGD
jgi:transcriptional regulator with XRE-family HTH domain